MHHQCSSDIVFPSAWPSDDRSPVRRERAWPEEIGLLPAPDEKEKPHSLQRGEQKLERVPSSAGDSGFNLLQSEGPGPATRIASSLRCCDSSDCGERAAALTSCRGFSFANRDIRTFVTRCCRTRNRDALSVPGRAPNIRTGVTCKAWPQEECRGHRASNSIVCHPLPTRRTHERVLQRVIDPAPFPRYREHHELKIFIPRVRSQAASLRSCPPHAVDGIFDRFRCLWCRMGWFRGSKPIP